MTRIGIAGLGTVALLGALAAGAAATPPIACVPAGTCESASVGFGPAYPSGTEYEDFILPSIGLHITDDDGDGAYEDERCGTDSEGVLALAHAIIGQIEALDTACEALPAGPNIACATPPIVPAPGAQEFCNMGLGVVAAALESEAVFITRCEMQGDFVNGAETQAAYEDTKLVLSRAIEERLRASDKLVSLFLPRSAGGRLEEVRALVELRIRQYEAADAQSALDWSREIGRAKRKLALGDDRYADARYRDAYRSWGDAYRELRDIHL